VHIAIVGGGDIGFALAQALAAHDGFAIDHAPLVADRFEPLDVQFLLATGTSSDVLRRAGIDRADVLIACTGFDEVDTARGRRQPAGSPRTFCFVSREEFLGFEEGPAGAGTVRCRLEPRRLARWSAS
jgi:trk system potassium uptake protein TrkA